jgi:hypothetical protein
VIAMLRPKPNMARLTVDPSHVQAAAQAAVDGPDGIGTIASYWTEVPLPATGTWNAPDKGGAQAGSSGGVGVRPSVPGRVRRNVPTFRILPAPCMHPGQCCGEG